MGGCCCAQVPLVPYRACTLATLQLLYQIGALSPLPPSSPPPPHGSETSKMHTETNRPRCDFMGLISVRLEAGRHSTHMTYPIGNIAIG